MSNNPNRKMRRKELKDMSLDERTREAQQRQYNERIIKCQLRMDKEWKRVIKANVPAWARWMATNVPPKWYIASANYLLNFWPAQIRMWLQKYSQENGRPFFLGWLINLVITLITFIPAFFFLTPFLRMRKYMMQFGVYTRIIKEDHCLKLMMVKHRSFRLTKKDPDTIKNEDLLNTTWYYEI